MNRLVTNKWFLWIAALIYLATLYYIVFLAGRRSLPVPERQRLSLIPFLKEVRFFTTEQWTATFANQYKFYSDFIGNFLLFIPLPIFLSFLFRLNYRCLILISFFTSIGIECIQYVLRIGVADIDDVIMNTSGAATGIFLLRWIRLQITRPE